MSNILAFQTYCSPVLNEHLEQSTFTFSVWSPMERCQTTASFRPDWTELLLDGKSPRTPGAAALHPLATHDRCLYSQTP